MKRFITLFLLNFCAAIAIAQCEQVFKVTFTVDDKLAVGTISDLRIQDSRGQEFRCRYFPGHVMPFGSNERVDTAVNTYLRFKFTFTDFLKKKYKSHEYWFDIPVVYLKKEYLVVNIYNLDKKRYKRRFTPLEPNRNYTFELDFGGGQLMRHRN